MKVYKFYELPKEYRKIIELPNDLMVIDHRSFLTETDTKLCHSELTGKEIQYKNPVTGEYETL